MSALYQKDRNTKKIIKKSLELPKECIILSLKRLNNIITQQ